MNGWAEELRSKPRLRLALLACLALVWLVLVLELESAGAKARQEQTELTQQLSRMQALQGPDFWRERRAAAFAELSAVRASAWREQSDGRAQARTQDWLLTQMANRQITPRETAVTMLSLSDALGQNEAASTGSAANGRETGDDIRVARLRASFDYRPESLEGLLLDLASEPGWVSVTRLDVAAGQRRLVEMDVEVLFVLGSSRGSP